MDVGDRLELHVTDVAHGGVFVARHEGRVVFVGDAIPGERVVAELTDTGKKSFWRAETIEVTDASADRRPHVWPAADLAVEPARRPGGADFGHIDLLRQRELKREVLADAVRRFGGLDVPVTVREAFGEPGADDASAPADADGGPDGAGGSGAETADGTRWRTRVSLHVDESGAVGPFAARSHTVIPVADLPLAVKPIEDAARDLRGTGPGRVDLVMPADGRVRVIRRPAVARPTREAGRGRGRRGPRSDEQRGERSGARSGGRPDSRRGSGALETLDPLDPAAGEIVREVVGGREFRVDAGGFWQVHRLAAHSLTTVVADLLAQAPPDPDALHLDLYGGVGLFAATLADAGARRIVSVESDPRATEHAGENLAEWVGARAETDRVDRWLARTIAQASAAERERLRHGIVLLDPPRAGAGRDVSEAIIALEPDAVVYVACDPVALGRDLKTFAAAGYRPDAVRGLDLFPNSHHVEAVALLRR